MRGEENKISGVNNPNKGKILQDLRSDARLNYFEKLKNKVVSIQHNVFDAEQNVELIIESKYKFLSKDEQFFIVESWKKTLMFIPIINIIIMELVNDKEEIKHFYNYKPSENTKKDESVEYFG